jgi:membrane peptidoglycan carboxypeptidase
VHHDPVPVTKITDIATGKTIFTYDPQRAGRRVIPENVAFIMNAITSNDSNRVQEFGRGGLLTFKDGRRVSAKTGTADFFLDNLTVGWTPDLLTASWVGSPQPSCLQFKDYGKMANFIRRGRIPDGGLEKDVTDPFTAQELRALGLQPIPERSHSCGHLTNTVSGISGAAPIWNDFMSKALKGTPKNWYTIPPDVIQVGTGDNADFYLPSARSNSGTCYYWGPAPDPQNPCQYSGTSPPPGLLQPTPTPAPAATPPPGGAVPTFPIGVAGT